jgi:hypothetical protein
MVMVSFRINGLRRFHARVCRWLHARHATSLCIQTLSVWYRYICKHCRLQCPVPRVWYLFCIRCSSHQLSFNNLRSCSTSSVKDRRHLYSPSISPKSEGPSGCCASFLLFHPSRIAHVLPCNLLPMHKAR